MSEELDSLRQQINEHLHTKDWPAARALLEQWLLKNPESVEARFTLGRVLISMELYQDAKLALMTAQRLNPNDTRIAEVLAVAMARADGTPAPTPEPVASTPAPQPAPAPEPAPLPTFTPVQTAAPAAEPWFIGMDGQQYGPYTTEDVLGLLQAGRATGATLIWQNGMAEWLPLQAVPAFQSAFAPANAMPPQGPPAGYAPQQGYVCPTCGAPWAAGQQYCATCGWAPPPPKPFPVKLVVTLVASLVLLAAIIVAAVMVFGPDGIIARNKAIKAQNDAIAAVKNKTITVTVDAVRTDYWGTASGGTKRTFTVNDLVKIYHPESYSSQLDYSGADYTKEIAEPVNWSCTLVNGTYEVSCTQHNNKYEFTYRDGKVDASNYEASELLALEGHVFEAPAPPPTPTPTPTPSPYDNTPPVTPTY